MKVQVLAAAIFLIRLSCPAQTLHDLLAANHLPEKDFSAQELARAAQGGAASNEGQTFLVYHEIHGDMLAGPLRVALFSEGKGVVIRRDLSAGPNKMCDGSLNGVSFLRDLTIVDLHINPSASCMLVLDGKLRQVRKIFGISLDEVAPYQAAIIENMIHFAPAHPERLLIADLLHPGSIEVYPPKDDALRNQFIAQHAKYMPAKDVCQQSNDPCDPTLFDEDIAGITTDGQGRFAFLASLQALHSPGKEQPPETAWTQTNLYLYQQTRSGWLYCAKEISDSQIERMRSAMGRQLDPATALCSPTLPVIPDRTTADYSPFATN